jgi:outer membrane protein
MSVPRLMSLTALVSFCFIAIGQLHAADTVPAANATQEQTTTTNDKPQWELGVGLGYITLPHYRGSDQRQDYIAPIPYVRYRGKRLNVDREGGRYYFLNSEVLKLDLSAAFSFPVDSSDNRARTGMPDLDPILELGPRLEWYIYASNDERFRIRAGFPVRLAVNLSGLENTGWVFSPYLQFRYFSTMETALSIGPMWATEKYHDYYYQVENQFATADRPAYDAQGGYSGLRITLTNSHRVAKHWWWGVFARYDSLSGAVFEDSPLVKQKDALMGGFALSYIFNPVKEYYEDQIE